MKKLFKLLSILILLWSCEADVIDKDTFKQERSLKPANKSNKVVQKLIEHGTKYNDILEDDEFLHVNDLLFSKNIEDYDYLKNDLLLNGKQYREQGIVSLFNLKISVYMDPSLRSVYLNGLTQAIADYNSLNNCGLFLEYTTSTTATIVINPKYSDDNFWGKAEFPKKSLPGHQVFINTRINGSNTSLSARRELFLHEIGHCLGLRHTNWKSNGEGTHGSFWDFVGIKPESPVHISGTPSDESDTNSVMWSSISTGFVGFSDYDRVALSNLYPHAYRFREVLNYSNYFPDGEKEISKNVYVDVFKKASYNNILVLENSSTVSYYKVTQEYNASNGIYCTPMSRTLTAGNNSYFLTDVREECSPYQGEICTREYLSASTCN